MANPIIVTLAADTWVKVATAVQTGQISIISNLSAQFLTTYRVTGDPPPTEEVEGIRISNKITPIRSNFKIDVYVFAQKKIGKIRVDL